MKLVGPFAKILGYSTRDRGTSEALISHPFNVTGVRDNARINNGVPNDRPENYAFCNVEYIPQRHVNMCGDACLNMLLAHKGQPHEKAFKHNPRGILEGLDTDQVKQKLLNAGLVPAMIQRPQNEKWSGKDLASMINEYGPVICSVKMRLGSMRVNHFVVVFGADQANVAYHDPWSGPNKRMSLDDFNKFLNRKADDYVIAAHDPLTNQVDAVQPSAAGIALSTRRKFLLKTAQ